MGNHVRPMRALDEVGGLSPSGPYQQNYEVRGVRQVATVDRGSTVVGTEVPAGCTAHHRYTDAGLNKGYRIHAARGPGNIRGQAVGEHDYPDARSAASVGTVLGLGGCAPQLEVGAGRRRMVPE